MIAGSKQDSPRVELRYVPTGQPSRSVYTRHHSSPAPYPSPGARAETYYVSSPLARVPVLTLLLPLADKSHVKSADIFRRFVVALGPG